jgi:hypothetical protein
MATPCHTPMSPNAVEALKHIIDESTVHFVILRTFALFFVSVWIGHMTRDAVTVTGVRFSSQSLYDFSLL